MTEVSILVPVLDRPHRVRPLVDSIRAATPEPHEILFLADPHDRATQDAIALVGDCRLLSPGGSYAHKINVGVRATSAPLLFFGADDLHFHPGWLAAVIVARDGGAQVIGTQDLCNPRVIAGEHATHFAVTREYAELPTIDGQPGPLFEGYEHEFVDDELIGTARRRGVYSFAGEAVVEHLHPDAGKAPSDALYAAQGARMRRSRPLYEKRRALWT